MLAEYLWYFIEALSNAIKVAMNHSRNLMDIITILTVTWLGIETALGKNEFSTLVEKILVLGISRFLIIRLSLYSNMALRTLLKLSSVTGEEDTAILENPAVLFVYAHNYIISPVSEAIYQQYSGANFVGAAVDILVNPFSFLFTAMYVLLILAVYICFAVIVVQIILNYISYHITLFFGYILAPFSLFKPLDFIGKNVFKALLTQTLTLSVIVFVANIGLAAFKEIFTRSLTAMLNANSSSMSIAIMWVILASILVYLFVCLQAPTLVMSIISGSPTLGAGGLISTVAMMGAAAVGVGSMIAGGRQGGQGVNTLAGPGAGAPAIPAAQGAGGAGPSPFLPRAASPAPSVNTLAGGGGSMAALPAGPQASPFLPAPARLMLEDRSSHAAAAAPQVPAKPMNDTDGGFSYKVL
jgi:type IV secretion system protein TrbL